MRPVAMFDEIETLPGAEQQAPLGKGNAQRDRQKCRFDMGRHIVRPLVAVRDVIHPGVRRRWHEATEEGLQINLDRWIRIFLDEQGAGRVADKDRQDPLLRPGSSDEVFGGLGKLVEPGPACLDRQSSLNHAQYLASQLLVALNEGEPYAL